MPRRKPAGSSRKRRNRPCDVTRDARSQWRPKRERKPRKRMIGFGYEIGMMARGANLPDVVQSACGDDDQGRAWQRKLLELLARFPTVARRRRVLEFFLRWFSGAVRHGSQWRVVDEAGFVGHKHELRPRMIETVDPESGEVFTREGKPELHHIPAASAGGIAGEMKLAPRTCDRYKRDLRGADRTVERGESGPGGLVKCKQPPFDAPHAVRPKDEGSKWAYAQAWLLLPPSSEMVRRWTTPAEERQLSPAQRAREGFPLPFDPLGLREILAELAEDSQAS